MVLEQSFLKLEMFIKEDTKLINEKEMELLNIFLEENLRVLSKMD